MGGKEKTTQVIALVESSFEISEIMTSLHNKLAYHAGLGMSWKEKYKIAELLQKKQAFCSIQYIH